MLLSRDYVDVVEGRMGHSETISGKSSIKLFFTLIETG